MPLSVRPALVVGVVVCVAACSPDNAVGTRVSAVPVRQQLTSPYPYSYIVTSTSATDVPASLDAEVQAAGGTVAASIPQIGIAIVESERADFADVATLNGIESIAPDVPIADADGQAPAAEVADGSDANAITMAGAPPIPAGGDPLSGLQWGLRAIHAPEAWALGYSGLGVRVAVLDAGIQSTHVDLAPNLNTALSASFVPGEAFNAPPGPHGTQVSGIIAAARNN